MNDFAYYYNKSFSTEANHKINNEIIHYAGIYILKKLDIGQIDNEKPFQIPLEGLNEHLEVIFDDLLFKELIEIDTQNTCYKLSIKGERFLDTLIEEIKSYINRFQEHDTHTRIRIMQQESYNILRVRFLWGLYDGEFDNLEQWGQEAGFGSESSWQNIITSKRFYDILFEELLRARTPKQNSDPFFYQNDK